MAGSSPFSGKKTTQMPQPKDQDKLSVLEATLKSEDSRSHPKTQSNLKHIQVLLEPPGVLGVRPHTALDILLQTLEATQVQRSPTRPTPHVPHTRGLLSCEFRTSACWRVRHEVDHSPAPSYPTSPAQPQATSHRSRPVLVPCHVSPTYYAEEIQRQWKTTLPF